MPYVNRSFLEWRMDGRNPESDRIRTIIEQQLQAFQRNDAEAAFSYASPEIQEKFRTPQNFLKMVKVAYPAMYRPRSVMFQDLIMLRGIHTQEVMLLAPDGEVVKALYLVEQQSDGQWKISGCFLMPIEGESI